MTLYFKKTKLIFLDNYFLFQQEMNFFYKSTFMKIDNLIYKLSYLSKHEGQQIVLVCSFQIDSFHFDRNDEIEKHIYIQKETTVLYRITHLEHMT